MLRTETDANMTMDRFLGIDQHAVAANLDEPRPTKHALAVATPPETATADKIYSDVDKVFDLQRQASGAHAAWLLAHKNEQYWDAKGKLHATTSREFKLQVRKIMGPAWCTENGHRLNATRTKHGILRLLARAANA